MSKYNTDYVVIGAGIVGLSVAMHLSERRPELKIKVLEKENDVSMHQTGHNSGVIHSGIYYKPGSSKAILCLDGQKRLYDFCKKHGIKHERCGKLIVATCEAELPALDMLFERGKENGLNGLRMLSSNEIRELEPHVTALQGIFVESTGIVDYKEVSRKYKEIIELNGGEVCLGYLVREIRPNDSGFVISTNKGDIRSKYLINCAGLHSDSIAKLSGASPKIRIIPFRGEYYKLTAQKEYLVNNLIYPVPDLKFPFLGAHFTRMINGDREVGPTAVLAFKKEGYKLSDFDIKDMVGNFLFIGFWKLCFKYWKIGFKEMRNSFFKSLYTYEVKKLIPEITTADLIETGAGVRAQAVDNNGKLIDDFYFVEQRNALHVLNAPSPAATASLAIGDRIATMVLEYTK
ncbi:MAG: L-2-hydroxyglutarate oxidase [Nitrospinota bacterium]